MSNDNELMGFSRVGTLSPTPPRRLIRRTRP